MKLILQQEVALKTKYFCDNVPGEISGIGKGFYQEKDKSFVVTDIIILKQTCTSGHTDIDDEALAKFMYDMKKAGQSLSDWNVWWHSHASMGTFWSSVDDRTINDHARTNDFLVSYVTNKEGDFKGRADIFPEDKSPFKKDIYKTYTLDVENEACEQMSDDIKELEELKSIMEKEMKEQLEQVDEEIESIKQTLGEDTELEQHCKDEIKDKVTNTVFSSGMSTSFKSEHIDSYHKHDGIYLPKSFNKNKKKDKKRKGEKGYYDGKNTEQTEFSKVLCNILGLQKTDTARSNASDNEEYVYEIDESEIDVIMYCDDCQNPTECCICAGKEVTLGDINDFLAREKNGLSELDLYEEKIEDAVDKMFKDNNNKENKYGR